MTSDAKTVKQYIDELPDDRRASFVKLRKAIKKNLPKGFKEEMSYGNVGYVVPHSLYPDGYHCNPKLPLPFASIANQKGSINFYHMGIYADKKLLTWFQKEYKKTTTAKLDMGKSCVRFKKMDDIPYDLIGKLMSKMTVKDWVGVYEGAIKNRKR
jgi:uncharacterized protein YdhG (YjbR/CyaY superfamily)